MAKEKPEAKEKLDVKSLEVFMAGLVKKHGPGSIKFLGGNEVARMERTSTGIMGLDLALGGGLPDGRMVEIYGPESSGKTTLTLHAIAAAQKKGKTAAFIDAEHSFDIIYARSLEVDTEKLLFAQPDTAEEALELAQDLAASGLVHLIVIDSVAALVPKAESEGEAGSQLPGLQARLMSQALRKLTPVCSNNKCTIFWINQIRMKIGVMFGSPETTSGGNSLKYYASIRMDVRKTGTQKDGEESTGNETRVKIVKNKTAPPYKEANFVIVFGEGVDMATDLLRAAVNFNIIEKKGAWYSYEGANIAQGEPKTAALIKHDLAMKEKLIQQINKTIETIITPEIIDGSI